MAEDYPEAGNWIDVPWFQWISEPPSSSLWAIINVPSSQGSIIEYLNTNRIIAEISRGVPDQIRLPASLSPFPWCRVMAIQTRAFAGGETVAFQRFRTAWDDPANGTIAEVPTDTTEFRNAVLARWTSDVLALATGDSRIRVAQLPLLWETEALDHLIATGNYRPILTIIERGPVLARGRALRDVLRKRFPGSVEDK